MTFGAFIRNKRKSMGIAQKVMARRVGIAPDHLGKIERRRYHPPAPDTVRRIAQALQLDENEMLALADSCRPPERDRAITPETRRKIGDALRNREFTEEHIRNLKQARQRVLARTGRKQKVVRLRSKCAFCSKRGPTGEKTIIRYEDMKLDLAICPDCFAQWQAQPDEAIVIPQEKTA